MRGEYTTADYSNLWAELSQSRAIDQNGGGYKILTVTLYSIQSSQNLLAENFLLMTTVQPWTKQ